LHDREKPLELNLQVADEVYQELGPDLLSANHGLQSIVRQHAVLEALVDVCKVFLCDKNERGKKRERKKSK
jgi:hypothetical protein